MFLRRQTGSRYQKMNKELTEKLVKRFPVIYQGFYDSPMSTCMMWGFDHGNGWFHIIWMLSLGIEEEIGYSCQQKKWFLFKKHFFKKWNALIYKLSPPRTDDWFAKRQKARKTKGGLTLTPLGLKRLIHYPYTGFAVEQVKQKYGGLRFYCPSNDAIDALISVAENAAYHTCEACGKPGKVRPGGLIEVLCDKCNGTDKILNKYFENYNDCLERLKSILEELDKTENSNEVAQLEKQADELRNTMDVIWRKLTSEQIDMINNYGKNIKKYS